ncbi:MAG: hypothetical protein ABII22_05735 [Candidatus Micrarchaeota archaeon]
MAKKNKVKGGAREKKSEANETKKEGMISAISGSFTDAGQLVFKKAKPLAINIFKVSLAFTIVVAIFSMAVTLLISLTSLSKMQPQADQVMPLISQLPLTEQLIVYFAMILPFILMMLYVIAHMAQYRIIDYENKDKKAGIIEHLNKCWKGILKLDMILIAYLLAIVVISSALGGSQAGGPTGPSIAAVLFSFIALVVTFAVLLIFPIAHLEVAINEKGAVQAIADSALMVKNNLWKTIIFFIPYGLLSLIFFSFASSGNQNLLAAMLIFVLFDTLGTLLIAPTFYFFWKRISD